VNCKAFSRQERVNSTIIAMITQKGPLLLIRKRLLRFRKS
jgi:hypothetical protein